MSERRSRVAIGLTLAGLMAAGCAGVPDAGPVHEGRLEAGLPPVADDVHPVVLPPRPHEDPSDLVRGYLAASAVLDEDNAIARQYLTSTAAARWHPADRVLVYDDTVAPPVGPAVGDGRSRVVTVRAPLLATLGADGGYNPAAAGQRMVLRLRLVRQSGEWRITNPPPQLLLAPRDLSTAFHAYDVFFLNRSLNQVVPDRVFTSASSTGVPTALVRALLRGPTRWLDPAVRSAIPAGTTLIGSVLVGSDGVATVNLSRQVLSAPPGARRELSAQLVWTLRQYAITGVRLLADGSSFAVPGAPAVQSRSAWPDWDPSALPADATGYYRSGARLLGIDGLPIAGPSWTRHLDHEGLTDLAMGPGIDVVAGLGRRPGHRGLYIGSLSRGLVQVLSASALTPPSVDALGETWTVQGSTSRVYMVPAHGVPERVEAPGLAGLHVRVLRVSRDGTRVAVVADGGEAGTAGPRLYLGRVRVRPQGGLVIDGLRDIAPSLRVTDASWADADRLVVLGSNRGVGQPQYVTVDGSDVEPVTTTPVGQTYLQIAAAPGRPLLVSFGRHVWVARQGVWRAVTPPGGEPAYPG